MKFVFRLSGYDDPALDGETVALLEQRLEAQSRKVMPGVWSITDKLNTSGDRNRKPRYRVYGAVLLALGLLALVSGLAEPRTPSLLWSGGFVAVCGVLELLFAGRRRPLGPPASCQREAARLLEKLRSADWTSPENRTELRFEGDGFTISAGERTEEISCGEVKSIFETGNLWLLIYREEQAILLQKKDLTEGDPAKFRPWLLDNMRG